MAVSDAVRTGNYTMSIGTAARQATTTAATSGAGMIPEGTVTINGVEIAISAGEDAEAVFEKLRKGGEIADVNIFTVDNTTQDFTDPDTAATGGFTMSADAFSYGKTLAIVSNQFGSGAEIEISCSNTALATYLGLPAGTVNGQDAANVSLDANSAFSAQATVSMDGNKVKITDISGFEMSFMVDPGMTGDLNIEVTDIGTMTLQMI